MKEYRNYILIFLLIVILVYGLNFLIVSNQKEKQSAKLSLVVKESVHGWIYEIYSEKTLLIRQETIPSIAGNYYFNNKTDAEKIGYLVLDKLANGVMPPTVSVQEIKNSNITIID
ncbi:MAG: DUF4907 domain-containing protein [Gelidibacter sp.]